MIFRDFELPIPISLNAIDLFHQSPFIIIVNQNLLIEKNCYLLIKAKLINFY